jgi:acyl transferase domain-containing protein
MKNAQKIAIVGIGCRYPDFVNNPEKLWTFLSQNGDGVREVPESRWDLDKYYDPNPEAPGKMYVKRASFLHDDPFTFDPAFFGMSPREAQTLDPQQRLLLETSYEAFQDAGIPMKQWQRRKVGVFVGGFMMDNQFLRVSEKGLPHINSHTPVSGSLTLLSNRISHAFDFCGPSISIDTACSSSLVAIHLACESLLSGNAELALAGGVNVMLGPQASILMCKGKFLARDGRSKAFFDHADGYGRGEGAGMVLLKRLDQAIADQDDIYAVIEATAVNQDGHTEGISLPSQDSQKAVIREAVAKAGIQAKEIDYVEAHGTGTKAGDPLELGAIGTLYGKPKEQPLYVGSIKTNLGHTEAAAGVSGLIKVALMLKNGRILPHLNLGKLNENIPFEELNVRIPLAGQESAYQGIRPRKAAVNSFGYGGTNAHAILSRYEAVAQPKSVNREDTGPCLIQLSARTPQALQQQARDMEAWLQAHPDTPLSSLAQHLNHKRDRHEYLQLFHPHTTKEFHKQLKSFEVDMGPSPATRSPKVAWIFTGMGPQWWGMGQQLYRKEPVFREQVEQCDTLFREAAGFSVLEELLKSEAESRITRNYLAQAANFFVQMGLSALWQSWDLRPDAIVGHSVGEVAAAVVAGALSLEQGIRLIYHRGCILEEIAGKGTLLAAGISLEEAEELLPSFPGVETATINSPQSVALAGTHEALKALEIHLLAEDRFAKFVRVEVAYHSSQADPLEEAFLQAFSFIQPQQAHTPLYSTLTGGLVRESIQDAHYWWRNVRQKVHLLSAIEAMVRDGYVNFMEIGPHPVLGSAVKEILNHLEQPGNTFFSLRRLKDEQGTLCQQLSQVIRAGVEIELPAFPNSPAIKLPLYSWDKEVYWEEAEELQRLRKGESEKHPFLQERIAGPEPLWKSSINRPALAFLKDHQVGGQIVFPGAGYVECLLALARHQQQGYPLVIEELTFDQPFTWDDNQFPELYIQEQQGEVRLTSQWEGHSKPHMKGRILAKAPFRTPVFPGSKAFPQLDSPGNSYAQLARCGLAYGPAFQGIEAISLQEREVFAHLQAPQGSEHFVLHPALLDAAFQALLLAGQQYVEQKAFLPIRIRSLRIFQEAPRSAYCYGRITLMKGEFLEADLQLLNEAREVVVEVKGLRCKQVSLQQAENPRKEWLYQYRWEAADLRQNASSSPLPLFTGRELANELPQDPFQLLIDLRPLASKDLFSQALSANQHLREWLRRPGLQKAKRVSILLENALLDESQYPTPPTNPAQSALLGQIRVAMTEMPEINLRVIDADHTPATDLLLAALLELEWDQEEIILREGKSYAGSLQRSQLSFPERESHRKVMPTAQPRRLDILKPGKLESLVLRDYSLGAPQGDELRIKVSHSSINFKDVMKAMGMLNDAALKDTFAGHEFGLEGTGVVEACGPECESFPGRRSGLLHGRRTENPPERFRTGVRQDSGRAGA